MLKERDTEFELLVWLLACVGELGGLLSSQKDVTANVVLKQA